MSDDTKAPEGMAGDGKGNQRWAEGRDSYVRPDTVIRTSDYEVAPIEDDNTAKAFIQRHHYSASYPSARWRYGLYATTRDSREGHSCWVEGDLVGVAVYSVPVRDVVLTKVFGGTADQSTELGRFVLLDGVPGNGETWFLARTHELLRRENDRLRGVVSFSDPFVRTKIDGTITCPGHVGTIYQASNGIYLGQARAEGMLLLPDGTSLPRRALSKVKAGDQGWYSVVGRLIRFDGVTVPAAYLARPTRKDRKRPLTDVELAELGVWIAGVEATLCRKVRHPGNHKYAWAFSRRVRKTLPPLDPTKYPKKQPKVDAPAPTAPIATAGAA